MHEFENIAFLDQQKTGTTTVVRALRRLLDEREIHSDTHGPIPRGFDRTKRCFVSVREPLSLYISLFKFGAGSSRGTLFSKMKKRGLTAYYEPTLEAFEEWLAFVLDPANAEAVGWEYEASRQTERIGILTFRFLNLCIPKSLSRMPEFSNKVKLQRVFERRRVYSEYVRTECLYEDLFAVLRHWQDGIKLKSPLTTMDDMIARIRTQNVSRKIDGLSAEKVSQKMRDLVRQREWMLYETFGYDDNPLGHPTACVAKSAGTANAS
jgi:hypothetical protein